MRNLVLQGRRKHAIYLFGIWEIVLPFSSKYFYFLFLPSKNVEVKIQTKRSFCLAFDGRYSGIYGGKKMYAGFGAKTS
jgi:hypothetical protein